MSTAVLPTISASVWMFVIRSLTADRFDAIASAEAGCEVRREEAGVLRSGSVDDQIGPGDAVPDPRVQRRPHGMRLERPQNLGRRLAGEPFPLLLAQGVIDQVDVLDAIPPFRVDNLSLAPQQPVAHVERDEKGVGPVGHIVDQAWREAVETAVVVDGGVEVAARHEERTGKHDVADAAVREVEGAAAPLGLESVQSIGQRSPGLGAHGPGDFANPGLKHAVGRAQAALRQAEDPPGRFGRAVLRETQVEQIDQRRRARAKFPRHARGVLPEIGRSESVAEKPPHLAGREAVVVAVDGNRQGDVGPADELLRQGARASAPGEEDDVQRAITARQFPLHWESEGAVRKPRDSPASIHAARRLACQDSAHCERMPAHACFQRRRWYRRAPGLCPRLGGQCCEPGGSPGLPGCLCRLRLAGLAALPVDRGAGGRQLVADDCHAPVRLPDQLPAHGVPPGDRHRFACGLSLRVRPARGGPARRLAAPDGWRNRAGSLRALRRRRTRDPVADHGGHRRARLRESGSADVGRSSFPRLLHRGPVRTHERRGRAGEGHDPAGEPLPAGGSAALLLDVLPAAGPRHDAAPRSVAPPCDSAGRHRCRLPVRRRWLPGRPKPGRLAARHRRVVDGCHPGQQFRGRVLPVAQLAARASRRELPGGQHRRHHPVVLEPAGR